MKKNNTNINTILFFLFIILLIAQIPVFFLEKKRETEGFLAPGTEQGGARWDGKAWNYITRYRSVIPPIDLNTEGGILGEMNDMQLLPSLSANRLQAKSYKRDLLTIQRPPPTSPPTPPPTSPPQVVNAIENAFSKLRNVFSTPQPVVTNAPWYNNLKWGNITTSTRPNPLTQQQNMWSSFIRK